MKWAIDQRGDRPGSWTQDLIFHNLLDDDDNCLGWIREDTRTLVHGNPRPFMACLNAVPRDNFPPVATLKEAKAQLIHHFVIQRLDDT